MNQEHIYDGEVHFLSNDFYYITVKYTEEMTVAWCMEKSSEFALKACKWAQENDVKIKDMQLVKYSPWNVSLLAQYGLFSLKFQVECDDNKQVNVNDEYVVDDPELARLKVLRCYYDESLAVCDPVTYQMRQQELIKALAEYLVYPLQVHEMAERSKFKKEEGL